MEKSTQTNGLTTTCEPPDSLTEVLVRQRVMRLAESIRKDGAAYPLTPTLVNIWVDVFVRTRITPAQIAAAFDRAERLLKFWPSPGEVLGFVSTAKSNEGEEKASLKWDELRKGIRLHYHHDLGGWCGPKISERTRRAINAAGGLAHLSECDPKDLVFARQRFIEAYLRWDELKQGEHLLPDGEVKSLVAGVADAKALPPSHSWNDLHSRGQAYCQQSHETGSATVAAKPRFPPQPMLRSVEEQKRILQEKGFLPG